MNGRPSLRSFGEAGWTEPGLQILWHFFLLRRGPPGLVGAPGTFYGSAYGEADAFE